MKKKTTAYIALSCMALILIFCLYRFVSCVQSNVWHDSWIFRISLEHENSDARELWVKWQDSSFIYKDAKKAEQFEQLTPVTFRGLTDADGTCQTCANINDDYNSVTRTLNVHRFDGKVDTLCLSYASLPVGYISAFACKDNWIVIQSKFPPDILGYSHLVNESDTSVPLHHLALRNYDYDGQRKVFDSNICEYWIVIHSTADIYGPLSPMQLPHVMNELGIRLPYCLEGMSDWYARTDNQKEVPHEFKFFFPVHKQRPNIIIK